ncbi:hypothetical protein Hanom_Chr10g00920461 [Helianthus anomalus]
MLVCHQSARESHCRNPNQRILTLHTTPSQVGVMDLNSNESKTLDLVKSLQICS